MIKPCPVRRRALPYQHLFRQLGQWWLLIVVWLVTGGSKLRDFSWSRGLLMDQNNSPAVSELGFHKSLKIGAPES